MCGFNSCSTHLVRQTSWSTSPAMCSYKFTTSATTPPLVCQTLQTAAGKCNRTRLRRDSGVHPEYPSVLVNAIEHLNTSVRACARVLPQFSCDFRRTVFSPNFLFIASLLPAACRERKQKKRLCQREESQWQSFLTRPQHPCYSPKAFSFLSHVKRYWKNCKADENVR